MGIPLSDEAVLARLVAQGECLVWPGARRHYGHGIFIRQHRTILVHRFVWELHHGPIPTGVCVCHHCDNPPCARIEHLFLGTNQENSADRHRKGRSVHGERVNTARITAADALAIFTAEGSYASIARRYGIAKPTVTDIKRRRSWKSVTSPLE